jgi:hypothetical protein
MAETKTTEKAKETEPKNIYEKMSTIKSKLLGIKKSGKNDFSHYSYFELGDIMPILTPALREERLYMKTEFSATEQVARLIILDMDFPDTTLEFETRVGSCTLTASHDVQNLGAAQTYTRRYLIITAFDIAESDIVDAETRPDDRKPQGKQTTQRPPATKTQQQTTASKPQDRTLDVVRRDAWELVKRLPQGEQAEWISSCKGADRKTLEQIIAEVGAILNAPNGQRLEALKAEFFTLLETLPQEAQNGWLDAGYDADEATMEGLLAEIKRQIATLEVATKAPPKQTKPAPPPANPADAMLEIF